MVQFAKTFVLALACVVASDAEPALEALDALPADDACSANPSREECSASFRQLRGLSVRAEAREHGKRNASEAEEEESEEDEPGVCCFSSEDKNDVCGTCYPSSIATDAQCSRKSQCGACGGSWCRSGCVMGAADPNRKCSTAFETGIAKAGTYCAKGKTSCASCNGEWCQIIASKKAGKDTEDAPQRNEDHGFCCYHADEDNMCAPGICTDIATDATCSTEKNCADCGGTWCAGKKCVIAFADKKNPCGTAYASGVAANDNYCSHSETSCSNCAGAWCYDTDIKFVNQDKDDVGKPGDDDHSSDGDDDEAPEGPSDEFPEDPADADFPDDADGPPASSNDTDGSDTKPSSPADGWSFAPAEPKDDGAAPSPTTPTSQPPADEEDDDAEDDPEDGSEGESDGGFDDYFDEPAR
mmetsp:Transcript_89178/g.265993  ORF Transcript_89178/g.265993 Transcript_89178/m.265993 type:complete len:413 (+) Transcript_89178:87-1325(+)